VNLDDVASELYDLDPSDFTAARDARAAEARKGGDRELAAAIRALRRPTSAAAALNLLARRRPEQVRGLADLGAALAQAQASLSADQIRSLGRQRHQVIAGLVAETRRLATAAGHPVGESVARQVESTLEAALADAGAGAALASGRLVRSLEHSGLGAVDLSDAVAGASGTGPPPPAPTGDGRTRGDDEPRDAGRAAAEREAARATQGAARAELEAAQEELAQADEERRRAAADLEDAEGRLRSALEEVRRLEDQLAEARDASGAAGRVREDAGARLERARRRQQGAKERLEAARQRLPGP
jgi:hypothetical protein